MFRILLSVILSFALINVYGESKCDQSQYRQFDFWLGNWKVFDRAGKYVGENRITREMGKCVIKESYTSVTGYHGESFNIFDTSSHQWHQTWVDNSGLLLKLDGVWDGKQMQLNGVSTTKEDKKLIQRIQWQPQNNGNVHQIWDVSDDDGKTWKNLFYGIYKK